MAAPSPTLLTSWSHGLTTPVHSGYYEGHLAIVDRGTSKLVVFDVSDPSNGSPSQTSLTLPFQPEYPGNENRLVAANGLAVVADEPDASNDLTLQVLDVSTPTAPVLRGSIVLPDYNGIPNWAISPDGFHALVQQKSGFQKTPMKLVSLADPDAPVLLDENAGEDVGSTAIFETIWTANDEFVVVDSYDDDLALYRIPSGVLTKVGSGGTGGHGYSGFDYDAARRAFLGSGYSGGVGTDDDRYATVDLDGTPFPVTWTASLASSGYASAKYGLRHIGGKWWAVSDKDGPELHLLDADDLANVTIQATLIPSFSGVMETDGRKHVWVVGASEVQAADMDTLTLSITAYVGANKVDAAYLGATAVDNLIVGA